MLALFGLTVMAEFPMELSPLVQPGKISLTCELEVRKYKSSWLIELLTHLRVSQAKNRGIVVPFSADPDSHPIISKVQPFSWCMCFVAHTKVYSAHLTSTVKLM